MQLRESYDSAARPYAEHLASELDRKPLDRHLLNRFAEDARGRGHVVDLGCGPGHVAAYLHGQGAAVLGLDLSAGMITCARRLNPGLPFLIGDMLQLPLPSASLIGVVAFYSIVHFAPADLERPIAEFRRVLEPGGLALIAFHVGDQRVHVDDLFGVRVDLDFQFHVPADVAEVLRANRFSVVEHAEREPYEGSEYPSRRAYLIARAA